MKRARVPHSRIIIHHATGGNWQFLYAVCFVLEFSMSLGRARSDKRPYFRADGDRCCREAFRPRKGLKSARLGAVCRFSENINP